MSVFDDTPAPFPFAIDFKSLNPTDAGPYRLAIGTTERWVFIVMSIFWLLFVPGLVLGATWPNKPDGYGGTTHLIGIALALAYIVLTGRHWLVTNIDGSSRTVDVSFLQGHAHVRTRSLFARSEWQTPLANFEGVGIERRGTGGGGAAAPKHAVVMLWHPDRAKSIPLRIDEARRVGANSARKYASALNVPVIETVRDMDGTPGYPPEQLVVSGWQGMKLSWLTRGFAAATAGFCGLTGYTLADGAVDPAYPVLAAVFALATAGLVLFARHYVQDMREDDDCIVVRAGTLIMRPQRIQKSHILSLNHRSGRMRTTKFNIETPWLKLSIAGRHLPFVIDLQSDLVRTDRLTALAAEAAGLRASKT